MRSLALRSLPILLAAAAAAAAGCVRLPCNCFFGAQSHCLLRPEDHARVPPRTALPGTAGGALFEEGHIEASVAVYATRRECLYWVEPRPFADRPRLGPYAEIDHLKSAAGRARWAMVARTPSGEERVILDGVEIAVEGRVFDSRFSSNGDHFYLVVFHEQGRRVFIDGKLVAPTPGARDVSDSGHFLEDGTFWLVEQTLEGRSRLVVGSWVSEPFDRLLELRNVGGRHFAAEVRHGEQSQIFFDGRSEWPKGQLEAFAMSRDGRRWGYLVRRDGRLEAVINGVPVEVPETPREKRPALDLENEQPYLVTIGPGSWPSNRVHTPLRVPASGAAP